MFKVLFCVVTIFYYADTAQLKARLPSYFEQCSRSSPTLSQCVAKSANKVIPRLVYGDVHYNIPYMMPLKLREIIIRNDHELRFILRNVEIYGLEKTKVTDANLDLLSNKSDLNMYNPRIAISGYYELNGKILNVPVNGNGKANITLINGHYSHGVSFVVNEESYAKFVDSRLFYTSELNIYHFENLFHGNDFLGYQTNIFLNNNWKQVSRSFQPGASNAINKFLVSIYEDIANIVPLNEAFLP